METKAEVRLLNGYRVVYEPGHPRAMTSDNWSGYVYEHILVVERRLGRPLKADEDVHHLDGDPGNNRCENLLLLYKSEHARLHAFENLGARKRPKYCVCCGRTCQGKAKRFCSPECYAIGARKAERPSKKTLAKQIEARVPWTKLGKMYGVTDNAVRKWARAYNLIK